MKKAYRVEDPDVERSPFTGMTRKHYLECAAYLLIPVLALSACMPGQDPGKIDRYTLVSRHRVELSSPDTLSALTVGNGAFAFTVDFTGLQSFPERYARGIPLGTQTEWGWHSYPDTAGYTLGETMVSYPYRGRQVPYSVQVRSPEHSRNAVQYFRQNPHRLHLGIVGLELLHADGTPVRPGEISGIHQVLDPWTGEILSAFRVDGVPVEVSTCCHREMDLVASRIRSPLVGTGQLRVSLHFPYPAGEHSGPACDWSRPDAHTSRLESFTGRALIHRQIDTTSYLVQLEWERDAVLEEQELHHFSLEPGEGAEELSFSCLFTPGGPAESLPAYGETAASSREGWKEFWMSGGAVDFSGSTDPRAPELERRVVLSQYLTRAQCAGACPPQETGLTYNSWYGKFHLEMHWWHGAHFALWGREELLARSLDYYPAIAEKARETARRQGFAGLRWPKMTDPWGNDSPSSVGSFLIWQQPHFITLAELCYRNSQDRAFLEKYAGLVFETADFMASYARYDSLAGHCMLGPLLIPAQERLPFRETVNPPFELVYWYYGLLTAQQWRARLGLEPRQEWEAVMNGLPGLARRDSLYLAAESAPDSYTNPRYMGDHPMVLGAFGMFPSEHFIDTVLMQKTFDEVWRHWQWEETWGWDFPMTAMAAARLGQPEKAVDALFMDVETNTYLPNGHNYQDTRLRLYLPGNGGLLYAVAMMCAGWEGGPERHAPGFPADGSWMVRWEGLEKAP